MTTLRVFVDLNPCLGLLSILVFLFVHRPKRWFSMPSMLIIGWPLIIGVYLARAVIGTTMANAWCRPVKVTTHNVTSVLLQGLSIVMTLFVTWAFLRYRHRNHPPDPSIVDTGHESDGNHDR